MFNPNSASFHLAELQIYRDVIRHNKKLFMNEKDIFKFERFIQEIRHIPLAELREAIEINKKLDALSEEDDELRKSFLPIPGYTEVNAQFKKRSAAVGHGEQRRLLRVGIEKEVYGDLENVTQGTINQAIEYLDSLDIWRYKFKTNNPRNRALSGVLPKPDEQEQEYQDSLYYVSDSGLSLRLKLANIRQGFSKVRQPVFEKIFFVDKQGPAKDWKVDDVPQVGWYVEETSSDRFNRLLEKDDLNSDFTSDVKLTEKDDRKVITYGDITHEGDAVKEIISSST